MCVMCMRSSCTHRAWGTQLAQQVMGSPVILLCSHIFTYYNCMFDSTCPLFLTTLGNKDITTRGIYFLPPVYTFVHTLFCVRTIGILLLSRGKLAPGPCVSPNPFLTMDHGCTFNLCGMIFIRNVHVSKHICIYAKSNPNHACAYNGQVYHRKCPRAHIIYSNNCFYTQGYTPLYFLCLFVCFSEALPAHSGSIKMDFLSLFFEKTLHLP